jgi:hypothetical protein
MKTERHAASICVYVSSPSIGGKLVARTSTERSLPHVLEIHLQHEEGFSLQYGWRIIPMGE